jgi:two-component system cell cycle sensor histidine kinase/response regulator CckA
MKLPLNILIVEDEAIIALGVQMELEQSGYGICQVVATGEEAIACVAQNPPDLILMDHRLAGNMDGIQAARAILAMHPLPIIFMTGYAADDIMQRAQSLNPHGYLIKPLQVYEIEPLIDSLITN